MIAPVLVVAAAVLDAGGRVLVTRRSAPPALAGLWEFPGGKVEPGETPEAGLARELLEELGIGVVLEHPVAGPCPDARTPAGAWPLASGVMAVWLARVASGVPVALQDHDDLAWVAASELEHVDWVPADRPIAGAVAALLA